jgi:NADH dehydrogenase
MGVRDAVGWIALKRNLVGGLPAKTLKDIVESQYDLFLDGIDAYVI